LPDVLIVEDDLTIADMLQEVLEAEGYRVSGIARTVDAAIELIELHQPDFAVIDLCLADGGLGTDVGAYLRATTKVGILYSTGNDSNALTVHLGDAVMTKPYRLTDVGYALKILSDLAETGQTRSKWPRNFRLLSQEMA
jgi:DNA-binding response OmpR family regulator